MSPYIYKPTVRHNTDNGTGKKNKPSLKTLKHALSVAKVKGRSEARTREQAEKKRKDYDKEVNPISVY